MKYIVEIVGVGVLALGMAIGSIEGAEAASKKLKGVTLTTKPVFSALPISEIVKQVSACNAIPTTGAFVQKMACAWYRHDYSDNTASEYTTRWDSKNGMKEPYKVYAGNLTILDFGQASYASIIMGIVGAKGKLAEGSAPNIHNRNLKIRDVDLQAANTRTTAMTGTLSTAVQGDVQGVVTLTSLDGRSAPTLPSYSLGKFVARQIDLGSVVINSMVYQPPKSDIQIIDFPCTILHPVEVCRANGML